MEARSIISRMILVYESRELGLEKENVLVADIFSFKEKNPQTKNILSCFIYICVTIEKIMHNNMDIIVSSSFTT